MLSWSWRKFRSSRNLQASVVGPNSNKRKISEIDLQSVKLPKWYHSSIQALRIEIILNPTETVQLDRTSIIDVICNIWYEHMICSNNSLLCLIDNSWFGEISSKIPVIFCFWETGLLWFPKTGDWERCGVRYFLVLRSTNVTRHEESALAQISGMFTAQMTFRNLGR